jgi:hypothetical protein
LAGLGCENPAETGKLLDPRLTIRQIIGVRFASDEEFGYFAYNFIKIQRTLRVTPAMAAGVTNRLWEAANLVALWEAYERTEERAA